MEHLAIKFKCPKHKEEQLATIKHIRTNLMMYRSFLRKGDTASAEAWLNSAVTTMDILVVMNENYFNNRTDTFNIDLTNIQEELEKVDTVKEEESPKSQEKTTRIQLWKMRVA